MEALPLQTRTLYAELLDRLRARRAARGIGHLPGAFVEKEVKGRRYLYFQHSEPGGRARQTYVGPAGERLAGLVARFRAGRREAARAEEVDQRLTAQLRAGGAPAPDGPTARVLAAFADAGVFAGDAVLVGTNAFAALGAALGWRWSGDAGRTADVDLAAVELAVEDGPRTDLPDVLSRLELGFLPVPMLDRKAASTSFMVRGGALRVDLVTPLKGAPRSAPAFIPALRAHAVALPFLDYLLEEPMEAAIPAGAGILLKVPQPARFALHKLLVAEERPRAERAKAAKDLRQAALIARALEAEAGRGELSLAGEALAERGKGWRRRARASLERLAREDGQAAELLGRAVP